MNKSIGNRLRARAYGGLEPPPGVSEEDLEAFERQHGVRLPADMRSYFRLLNGTGSNYADGDEFLLCFWALEKLEPDPELTTPGKKERWFMFADHCFSAEVYAIRLTPDGSGPHTVCAKSGMREVAGSFTEFVEMYLAGRWIDLL
jgi:hypothetical protein